MSRITSYSVILLFFATLAGGCRKEDPAPLFETRSSREIMYDIAFDGGAIEGRWTMNYEEYLSYVNDIPTGFDSLSHANGEITLEFFSNGNVRHVHQSDTTNGTYSVAGSQLTLNLSTTFNATQFGIDGNRMHIQYTAIVSVGADIYRDVNEYLLTRY